jgi:hypothetical protein
VPSQAVTSSGAQRSVTTAVFVRPSRQTARWRCQTAVGLQLPARAPLQRPALVRLQTPCPALFGSGQEPARYLRQPNSCWEFLGDSRKGGEGREEGG